DIVALYTRFATPLSLSVTTGVMGKMLRVGAESSLRIVPKAVGRAIHAWIGCFNVTVSVSSGSRVRSESIRTRIVAFVCPGGIVSVPFVGTKSTLPTPHSVVPAVPVAVAKFTVTGSAEVVVSHTVNWSQLVPELPSKRLV